MEPPSRITESGQYFRVCNSCLRNLNISEFGTLWNGPRGFNATCKICRRQTQRAHYRKTYQRKLPGRAKAPDFISSLNAHNQQTLLEWIQNGEVCLIAICLAGGGVWTLQIKICRDSAAFRVQLGLIDPSGVIRLALEINTAVFDYPVEICVRELKRRSLRLQPPAGGNLSEIEFLQHHTPGLGRAY